MDKSEEENNKINEAVEAKSSDNEFRNGKKDEDIVMEEEDLALGNICLLYNGDVLNSMICQDKNGFWRLYTHQLNALRSDADKIKGKTPWTKIIFPDLIAKLNLQLRPKENFRMGLGSMKKSGEMFVGYGNCPHGNRFTIGRKLGSIDVDGELKILINLPCAICCEFWKIFHIMPL